MVSRNGAKRAKKNAMNENELSKIALDVAFKIHKELDQGFLNRFMKRSWPMNLFMSMV